jgi:hypothetical protein
MGWGIDFSTDIFLSKQDYGKNEYQVRDAIQEVQLLIANTKNEISMFASANPKDIVPKDWSEEPIKWISATLIELMNDLEENNIQLFKLNLYLEHLQENNK